MSFTVDLVDGLARLLDSAGVATYRADAIYGDTDTGIVDTVVPDTPDRVVVLTVYAATESAALTDTTVAVQVRTRAGADPREVAALDDAVRDVLHGAGPLLLGTIPVALISRQSSAVLGPDDNGRHERTSNYSVRANRAHPKLA